MRLGDLDFPIDPRTLESGAISWTDAAASIGCPSRATRRLEELEAAARLQSALAATAEASGRWCPATSGFVEVDGREAFYVVSRLPDGAQPLAALLEAAAAEPAGGAERRRATLAWSLGVGALRALLDLHERGTHHGELSPESAIRDRIVVRRRTTDPKDLEVDVALQFPSPRLALLLEAKRQPEVGSAEQTDVARLAHILRAILHGRDVLDPDTGVDDMLLSRVFGAQQQAWQRFFEDAAAGALHADPEFIRRQLALLEPARPDAGGSGQLHDVRFKLRRLFAKPAARWGAAAAAGALVATVGLVLAWDTLFPPPTWTVEHVAGKLEEGETIEIRIKTEGNGSDPTEKVVAKVLSSGQMVGEVPFTKFEDNWEATLPNLEGDYELEFLDKGPTRFKVKAENNDPDYEILDSANNMRPSRPLKSNDEGILEFVVRGFDEDSVEIKEPTVKVGGKEVKLEPDKSVREQPESGTETLWRGHVKLMQSAKDRPVSITIEDIKKGNATILRVPYDIDAIEPRNRKEGDKVRLSLRPIGGSTVKPNTKTKVTVSFNLTDLPWIDVPIGSESGGSLELPESDRNYDFTVLHAELGEVLKEVQVSATDDQTRYELRVGNPGPGTRPDEVKVPVTIIAEDVDTPSERLSQPKVYDGDTLLDFSLNPNQAPPSEVGKNRRKWQGSIRASRKESARKLQLELKQDKDGTLKVLATGNEVPVDALGTSTVASNGDQGGGLGQGTQPDQGGQAPRGDPVQEPSRKMPTAAAAKDKIEEGQEVEIFAIYHHPGLDASPPEWRLERAPTELQEDLKKQLRLINDVKTRSGKLKAPQSTKPYEIELALRSSEHTGTPPSTLTLSVDADDDEPQLIKVSVRDGRNGRELRPGETAQNLSQRQVQVEVTVSDSDSTPGLPEGWGSGFNPPSLAAPIGSQEGAGEARFEGVFDIKAGVDTRLEIRGGTYIVRWDPKGPADIGLNLKYGWATLPDGRFRSEQIGKKGKELLLSIDRAGKAIRGVNGMGTRDLQELLSEINHNVKLSGFTARIVTLEEWKASIGETLPTAAQVVGRVVAPKVLQDIGDASLDGLKRLLEAYGVKTPDRDAKPPQRSMLTFVSVPAAAKAEVTTVGIPLVPAPDSANVNEYEVRLTGLLGAGGKWDPKPWEPERFTTAYAVIVVEQTRGGTAEQSLTP